MPVSFPISLQSLSTEEFRSLDYRLMAHAFASQQTLGRLADESVYQADFAARIGTDGFDVRREVPVTVSFRDFVKTYCLDVVVDSKGVYELKTVAALAREHEAQLLNYLLLLDCGRGKLVNFRSTKVESRFVNAPMTTEERRRFDVSTKQWQGDAAVCDWVVELLRDLGTGLELALYQQAVVHRLGGESLVIHQLPMRREGADLGNQRFHLMEPDAAFRITALEHPGAEHTEHFKRLLRFSPLRAMHWINIARHHVSFTTVA